MGKDNSGGSDRGISLRGYNPCCGRGFARDVSAQIHCKDFSSADAGYSEREYKLADEQNDNTFIDSSVSNNEGRITGQDIKEIFTDVKKIFLQKYPKLSPVPKIVIKQNGTLAVIDLNTGVIKLNEVKINSLRSSKLETKFMIGHEFAHLVYRSKQAVLFDIISLTLISMSIVILLMNILIEFSSLFFIGIGLFVGALKVDIRGRLYKEYNVDKIAIYTLFNDDIEVGINTAVRWNEKIGFINIVKARRFKAEKAKIIEEHKSSF